MELEGSLQHLKQPATLSQIIPVHDLSHYYLKTILILSSTYVTCRAWEPPSRCAGSRNQNLSTWWAPYTVFPALHYWAETAGILRIRNYAGAQRLLCHGAKWIHRRWCLPEPASNEGGTRWCWTQCNHLLVQVWTDILIVLNTSTCFNTFYWAFQTRCWANKSLLRLEKQS
jgi:hypothetical protein